MSFSFYLKSEKKLNPNYAEKLNGRVKEFCKWLENKGLTVKNAGYNEIMTYVSFCRSEGNSSDLIYRKLNAIKKYYTYLQQSDYELKNPVRLVKLKDNLNRKLKPIVNYNELKKVYFALPFNTKTEKLNKVIFSILIYQGITEGEIKNLKLNALKLEENSIYIKGTKNKSRTLQIFPEQKVILTDYLLNVRPLFDKRQSEYLLIGQRGSQNISPRISNILKQINKSSGLNLTNVQQIRQSVIANWLKTNNLRQVQHMAGHSSVQSTEFYKMADMDDLKNAVLQFHPLRNEEF